MRTTASRTTIPAKTNAKPGMAHLFDEGMQINSHPRKEQGSPKLRSTLLAGAGMCQMTGPVRPSQPRTSAATSGPPARPRVTFPTPGIGIGIRPTTAPSAIPSPSGDETEACFGQDRIAKSLTTASRLLGSMTRTRRSPYSSMRSGRGKMSASARRTCTISIVQPGGCGTSRRRIPPWPVSGRIP